MLKNIILTIIVMLFSFNFAFAGDNYVPVRVGISDTKFQTYLFDTISFNNPSEIDILDSVSGISVYIPSNVAILKVRLVDDRFEVYANGKNIAEGLIGPILIRPKENAFVSIDGLTRKGKQAFYRGYIELVKSDKDIKKFAVVNVLSLKDYLKGVVPNEMPVRFGLEALKAQSVAARNYAVTPRVKAYNEFDLCDSVACQVYFGANTEEELSNQAIEETNSILALDNEDKPILALYSSTAGGYTESYEYAFSDPQTKVFPSIDLHYLKATPDNIDFGTLETEEKAQEFYTSTPEAFDDESPYYRWTKEWTKNELEKVLSKTLVAQSKTGFVSPVLESESEFGNLQSIKVIERGKSGKIITLEIVTDKNTFVVQKELVIRRCFQKDGKSLPSANFVVSSADTENQVYKFYGGGFGHGVGLSQWGAGKMASLGYTFDEILQHYYTGIKLVTMAIKVKHSGSSVVQKFYLSNDNAKVLIENPYGLQKIKICVNNKDLDVKLKDDKTIIDISKYIEIGNNEVTYMICDEDIDSEKYITAAIIVKEEKDE